MSTLVRRIGALTRASARRERMEPDLRAALEARREECAQLHAQVDQTVARLNELQSVADQHRARIVAMMTGAEPFSIDIFDGCRRYLEVVESQCDEARAELDTRRSAVVAKEAEVAGARRAIALNRGRIDVCRKRTKQLQQTLDQVALDAEDEAAEELASARRSFA